MSGRPKWFVKWRARTACILFHWVVVSIMRKVVCAAFRVWGVLMVAIVMANRPLRADEPVTVEVDEPRLAAALERAGENRSQLQTVLDTVPAEHRAAARFLIAYMPDRDLRTLSADYLVRNISLAYHARESTPWGRQIPEEVFLNDVLPYAAINERRDDWRAEFVDKFLPLVLACKTPGEAAQVLNRDVYPILDVKYHASKRPKPDQSPLESIEAKYASCTGLSVLLIDACRAVCVPARFAGTPSWATKRGNHSWVEIWSDGQWHFTGACEYDPNGLDRGWFIADASQAKRDERMHAIYATSWRTTGTSFPMIWNLRDQSVAAVNVTDRYAKPADETEPAEGKCLVGIEVWSDVTRERVVCQLAIRKSEETLFQGNTTGAGNDTNHRLEVELEPEQDYTVEIVDPSGGSTTQAFRTSAEVRQVVQLKLGEAATDVADQPKRSKSAIDHLKSYLQPPRSQRGVLFEQPFATEALSRQEAIVARELIWQDFANEVRESRAEEMEQRQITIDDKTLKFQYKTFGEVPSDGRRLFISLHGGGNAPTRVNDRQWVNQQSLYEPEEGIYLAPRAPTDTWDLWHQSHIDALFDRLITNLVVFEGVNPNRVYVMGYSAGGDGVYQLAPRMADRWAAAAMMAGHPNDASPLGLRNIGFALHMGANDGAYNRNEVAKQWQSKLAELQQQDSGGYRHQAQLHDGKGHWMDREDAVAVPWMSEFVRDPFPSQIVWHQDDVTHRRFYWLAVDDDHREANALIRATREGQTISLSSEDVDQVSVLLDDQLVDLDQPVVIRLNDVQVFAGKVNRTIASLAQSLGERADPALLPAARVTVSAAASP